MTEGIVIERKTGGEEPPVGMKGPDIAYAPSDQGNDVSTPSAQPGSAPETAPGITEKPEQAKAEPSKVSSTDMEQAQKKAGIVTNGNTLDTKPSTSSKEAKLIPSHERDVSPGTMPDGSHAQTSGDRGESYTPTTMSKLKNKFHIGGGK